MLIRTLPFVLVFILFNSACQKRENNNQVSEVKSEDEPPFKCSIPYQETYDPSFHIQENIEKEFPSSLIKQKKYKVATVLLNKKLHRQISFDEQGRTTKDIQYGEFAPGVKASITEYNYTNSVFPESKKIYWSSMKKDEFIRDIDKSHIGFVFQGNVLRSWHQRSDPMAVYFGGNHEYHYQYDHLNRVREIKSTMYDTDGSILQRWIKKLSYQDSMRNFTSEMWIDTLLVTEENFHFTPACDTLYRNVTNYRMAQKLTYKEKVVFKNEKPIRITTTPAYYGEDTIPEYWNKEFIYSTDGLIDKTILYDIDGKVKNTWEYVYK